MVTEIKNGIYYVGVNDRNKHLFEGLWPLPNGVSYNSYVIVDEKVTLVDTVEVDFFTQFLENIKEVIGEREIDYLVINHMEPDHSGSIALIKKYYPNIKIVGNKKTLGMLEGFYGVTDDVVEVKNGETLSTGNHELSFVLIPMVHWPETMVTLDAANKVLFSGDAFGCFGALNGGVIDEEINCEGFWLEMVRYYSQVWCACTECAEEVGRCGIRLYLFDPWPCLARAYCEGDGYVRQDVEIRDRARTGDLLWYDVRQHRAYGRDYRACCEPGWCEEHRNVQHL